MSREAMKQALEALEIEDLIHRYEKASTPEYIANAITALRQALANEALDRMAENARELGLDYEPAAQRWAVFCSECKKEWSVSYPHPGKSICSDCEGMSRNLEKPAAQAEYERGFIDGLQKQMQSSVDKAVNSMSRQWVGLTDEEIQAVLDKPEPFYDTMFWFARTIERKLKEKNT